MIGFKASYSCSSISVVLGENISKLVNTPTKYPTVKIAKINMIMFGGR